MPKAERRERAEHFIDMVGLSSSRMRCPKMLSGGMKQRCAIARAYAVNPSILLMDEPFGALDALTRVKLQEQLLDTWSREKRTVMFITHDVDEAVFLANRVIVMAARPGRIYDVIDVDLPYPRTEDVRLSPEFARAAQPRVAFGVPPRARPHRRNPVVLPDGLNPQEGTATCHSPGSCSAPPPSAQPWRSRSSRCAGDGGTRPARLRRASTTT